MVGSHESRTLVVTVREAEEARLSAEVASLSGGLDREIVTLESESFEVLQRTHASYFRGPEDLMASLRRDLPAA
jgi:hypothetical protein